MPKFYSQDFCQKVIEAIELNGHKKGEVSELFNMIAAYCNRQLMALFTIEGPCNRNVFET